MITTQFYSKEIYEDILRQITTSTLKPGQRLPSIRELARRYHVSPGTVQSAIKELSRDRYVDSWVGRGVFISSSASSGKKKDRVNIGILFPGLRLLRLDNPEYVWKSEMCLGIQNYLLDSGHLSTLCPVPDEGAADATITHNNYNLDGLISFPKPLFLTRYLTNCRRPFLTINQQWHGQEFNYISFDYEQGGRLAAGHLTDQGCRKFWIMAQDLETSFSSQQKVTGFTDFLKKHAPGCKADIFSNPYSGAETGLREFKKQLADNKDLPDAVFCSSNRAAYNVLEACLERNIKVPQDLAIMGFWGVVDPSLPKLTCIYTPLKEIGAQAAQNILRMVETDTRQIPGLKLEVELRIGETTRATSALLRSLNSEFGTRSAEC